MIYIIIIIICIFIISYSFRHFKKVSAKKALHGVDVVKAGLYCEFKKCFSIKNKQYDEDYRNKLAAAAVNEIFGDYSEVSLQVFNENRELIIDEIRNWITLHPESRRIITDSIRIYIQAQFMLSGKIRENTNDIIDNAIERGLFIKGGEAPKLEEFLKMTSDAY